ncbi:hypothetical protein KJ656_15020, partial [bacterium]|nr:hypothetical protein [bacterium]
MRNLVYALIINILLLISIFNRFGFSNPQYIKTKQPVTYSDTWLDDNHWIWQAHLNSPDFHYSLDNEISLSVEQLDNDSRIGYPSLPRFVKLFNALPEDITFHTSGKNLTIIPLLAEIERFTDISKPDLESVDQMKNYTAIMTGIYPKEVVSISFVGYVDNVPLTRLTVYPYQLIANGKQLRYYQDL